MHQEIDTKKKCHPTPIKLIQNIHLHDMRVGIENWGSGLESLAASQLSTHPASILNNTNNDMCTLVCQASSHCSVFHAGEVFDTSAFMKIRDIPIGD